MEQGSSIVWRQLLHLRFPLDELREVNPQFANDLQEVSQKIDAASVSHANGTILESQMAEGAKESPPTMEAVARNHRANVATREELLDKIRKLTGFEDFLKPARFAVLRDAARHHPIVAINISSRRCDALVIFSSHPIKHIPLTQLTAGTIDKLLWRFMGCLEGNEVRSDRNARKTKYDRLPSGEDDLNAILADLWTLIVSPIWEEMKDLVSASCNSDFPS
jgi:hypothetical protein